MRIGHTEATDLQEMKKAVMSTSSSGATTQGEFGNDTIWGGERGGGKAGCCCKDQFRGWQCQVPGHGEKFPLTGGVIQCLFGKETHCSWKSKSSLFTCHQQTARLHFLHSNCGRDKSVLGQENGSVLDLPSAAPLK